MALKKDIDIDELLDNLFEDEVIRAYRAKVVKETLEDEWSEPIDDYMQYWFQEIFKSLSCFPTTIEKDGFVVGLCIYSDNENVGDDVLGYLGFAEILKGIEQEYDQEYREKMKQILRDALARLEQKEN